MLDTDLGMSSSKGRSFFITVFIFTVTYFVCTQLKVVRNDTQVPKLLYLTTTNESRVFITGEQYLGLYFIGDVIYFLLIKLIFISQHSTTR